MAKKVLVRRAVPPITHYWLDFDGTDDWIALPSGEGREPSAAVTIEAWVQGYELSTTARTLITCGTSYTGGYSGAATFNTHLETRLALKDVDINGFATQLCAAPLAPLPVHVAMSWDGSHRYLFVNGVLLAIEDYAGTIGYTGTQWTIGNLNQTSGLWPFDGQMTMLRVSDVCRYTASFTPPTSFTSDANTVGLWLCQEGSGTSLADSGPGAHNGTFKAAGEPAWGGVADLTKLTYGDDMWALVNGFVPEVTDTYIYVHRTSADAYEVYRKVHATGPYWVKWQYLRGAKAMLEPDISYTGIPDPANDDPTSWSTDPAVQFLASTTEYVFYVTESGSVESEHGSVHGNEVMDSETWRVDGSPVVLGDGDWAHGSTVEFSAAFHFVSPSTSNTLCNGSKTHTFDKTVMWVDRAYTFTWAATCALTASALFPLMASVYNTNLTRYTYIPGVAGGTIASNVYPACRTNAGAAWKDDNGIVFAQYIDFADGMRYAARDYTNVNGTLKKIYFHRSWEYGGVVNGTVWHYHTRYLLLDNCGNHALKTA